MRNVAIFANPIAGRGRGKAIAQELRSSIEAAGMSSTVFLESPADVGAWKLEGFDALIVVGGDGSVRAVVRRFLQTLGFVPPILIVAMGTANLMARHLKLKRPLRNIGDWAARLLLAGKTKLLDAARANGDVFLLMTGVGFDGMLIHEVHRKRIGPINYHSYLLPALWCFATYDFAPLSVSADQRIIFQSAPAMAFVGNLSEYGTGFPLLPDARGDDGLLDVCVVPLRRRGEAVDRFLAAAAGELSKAEGVVYVRAKEVIIESERPIPVQVDGDPAGTTPVRIDLLPNPLAFIVPS